MSVREILQSRRLEILEAARHHGASDVRLFGSVLRGEERPDSDVDILVKMDPDRSLLDMGALLNELERMVGRRVDLVSEKGLHWRLRDAVLKEARPI
jgi:predicted nucleotidyltransferase